MQGRYDVKKWFDVLLNLVFGGICLFLLWILAQVFVFASFRIPSDSMSPELKEGAACGGSSL